MSEREIEFYCVERIEPIGARPWRSVPIYCGENPAKALRDAEVMRDRLGRYEFTVVGIPKTYA